MSAADATIKTAQLIGEIQADRADRQADRAESVKCRELMSGMVAIGQDRIRVADAKRVRAEGQEDAGRTVEVDLRRTRWAALSSVGAYFGGLLRQPLAIIVLAASAFVAASYLQAPRVTSSTAVQTSSPVAATASPSTTTSTSTSTTGP